ncbi:MAG: glycosyltransferase family 9 protein [Opitutae bacterium]|jgi:ADP-heptose:LPS heptosyltransferase|nr:glycosyltransferase family 9 protein [Opitutae bacterium]
MWLTVIDRLGAPGDALITANVIRGIKNKYPQLKINCITPHPELIKYDPLIDSINNRETFYSFDSSYWELVNRKDSSTNVVEHSLGKLSIGTSKYKSCFYLSEQECAWGKRQTEGLRKPVFSINTKSKELVKTWPDDEWKALVPELLRVGDVIQLGDEREPKYKGVKSFAGNCTMRESAAIMNHTDLFIGPDSLLMHIANGLDIPSVILFGGSRPVQSLGYEQNINLSSSPDCSPCWIHDGFEKCEHKVKCMNNIKQSHVLDAVSSLLSIEPQIYQNN